ncbi:hypothetical protein, partial [Barnesiella intestinihominis]|uniref:hypothetical protein n=1 Tax=Barnesiella intestinihominis TaxID=487174 RepID=UPI00265CEE6A
SPCGHSPYLICDEQRERIKSVACYNPTSFLSKHSNLLPCRVPWYYGVLRQQYKGDTSETVVS